MNPSLRMRYPRKERNSNYAVMTAFTLVAEVAEQIISGVERLTKEAFRDLQNSPTTTGVITWRVRNLLLWDRNRRHWVSNSRSLKGLWLTSDTFEDEGPTIIRNVGNCSTSEAVSYRRGKIPLISYCEILRLSESRVITRVVRVVSMGQNVGSFGEKP